MRKWLNIYFNFSKREFNGLLVMIVLLAIVNSIPTVYEWVFPERDDLPAERAALQKLILIEAEKDKLHHYKRGKYDRKRADGRLFNFDPNHTALANWQLLGFSAKQAAVLLKYTEKGGRFRKKEDLRKMYPVSPQMYTRLEPYIRIGTDSQLVRRYSVSLVGPRRVVLVSLNTADTLALVEVKGIGPAFARRIVKYRERLGGFYKKEQLLEVYGLDSAKYQEIKDQLRVDGQGFKRININTAVFADLKNHPYLNYKQVNALIEFRKQHGNYSNIADLKKVAILPAPTIEKLVPYISFDHD